MDNLGTNDYGETTIENGPTNVNIEMNDMTTDDVKVSIENDVVAEKRKKGPVLKTQVSKYEFIVGGTQKVVHDFFYGNSKRTRILKWSFVALLCAGWMIYIGFANAHSVMIALPLDIISGLVIFCLGYYLVKKYFGEDIWKCCLSTCGSFSPKASRVLKWLFYLLVLIGIGLILYFLVGRVRPKNLISAAGIVTIVLICFLTSTSPAKVKWRPVLWGLGIQLIFGLIVLRWEYGFIAFSWLANQVTIFLKYADVGSAFVFGPLYCNFPLVFQAIPQAIFFSSVMSILYHYGVIQQIIQKLGWLMEVTLGTTAVESINATANIFISSVEAAVIIRNWLPNLTYSELHAVMCGGFATVAGVVMAIYVTVGVPAEHLLSAAIMSAPAALALGKLNVPETEISKTKAGEMQLEKPSSRNLMEAASNGAVATIKLIGHVVVNLIAFIALLSFVNAVLHYLGIAIGFEELSFPWISSKMLKPFAYVLGISWEDAEIVGELIGTKIFVSSFISYTSMNGYYQAGKLSTRSRDIATYTLCGFGSFSDIGINVSVFGAFAPTRKSELAEMGFRACIMGNMAGFLTACIAGLLSQSEETYVTAGLAATNATAVDAPLLTPCS